MLMIKDSELLHCVSNNNKNKTKKIHFNSIFYYRICKMIHIFPVNVDWLHILRGLSLFVSFPSESCICATETEIIFCHLSAGP